MKKILIGLVLLAAFTFLLGPFVAGYLVESRFQESLQSINKNVSVKLKTATYQRGWFSSKVTFEVPAEIAQVMGIPAKEGIKKYFIDLKINHGPVIFSDSGIQIGLGNLRPVLSESITNKIGNKISSTFRFNFARTIAIYVDIKDFEQKFGEGKDSNVIIKKFKLDFTTNLLWNAGDFATTFDKIAYASPEMNVAFFGYKAKMVYGKRLRDAGAEKSTGSLKKLLISSKKNDFFAKKILVTDLESTSITRVKAGNIEAEGVFKIKSLQINDSKPISFVLPIRLLKLDEALYIKLEEIVSGSSPDIAKAADVATELINKEPELHFDNIILTIDGNTIKSNVLLKGVAYPKGQKLGIFNFKYALYFKASVDLSKQALTDLIAISMKIKNESEATDATPANQEKEVSEQIKSLVDLWKEQNIIAKKGDNYRIDLEFKKGKMILNGKEIP